MPRTRPRRPRPPPGSPRAAAPAATRFQMRADRLAGIGAAGARGGSGSASGRLEGPLRLVLCWLVPCWLVPLWLVPCWLIRVLATAMLVEAVGGRPVHVADPAPVLEDPDDLGRDVNLTGIGAVPGAGRVGMVHVVPALAE